MTGVRLGVLAAAAAMAAAACRRQPPAPAPVAAPAPVTFRLPAAPPQGPPPAAPVALPAPEPAFATWPMPNAPASGLPSPTRLQSNSKGFVTDGVTGLMWQRTVDGRSFAWAVARAYCDGLELGGFDDWRLPSRIELVSIVDVTHTQPSIDQSVFPRAPSDWFWTSSVDAADPRGAAWYVYFYFGYPKTDPMGTEYRARCVRGSSEFGPLRGSRAPPRWAAAAKPPSPDASSGSGSSTSPAPKYRVDRATVRDEGTGLTWQRAAPTKDQTFEGARATCAALRLGGQSGWRVPSLGELLTLVDERTFEPAIDRAAFPGAPVASFWTSTPFADTPAMAWHVRFGAGNALYGLLKGPHRVRCVR